MATEICAETKTEAVTLSSPLTSETRRPIIIIIHRRNNRGDRGRLVPPPTFRLGDQQCIGPPQLLAVVFKKQEISQQVLLLLNETQSVHINYSALRRHFS